MPTDFPRELGKTARRVLALNGLTRWEQLTGTTPTQLLAFHGVGPKAVRILTAHLAERGLAFSETTDPRRPEPNRPPGDDVPEQPEERAG